MKLRWITRTSLFARMSLLFGLLVTVPLVISGIVLSLSGWHTVHESGDQVARIGESALGETSNRFRTIARERLSIAANEIAKEGQERLEETSRKAVDKGKVALKKSVDSMSDKGKVVVGEATRQMARVSQDTLRTSLKDLRTLNRQSLQSLKNRFSRQMTEELNKQSSPAREKLSKSVIDSWRLSADRRALSVEDYARRTQFLIVKSLALPLAFQEVQSVDAQYAPEIRGHFETHVRKNFIPEIVRVVLVSPTGQEVARIPETEEEEDWADPKNTTRPAFLRQRSGAWVVEPPRLDSRSNRWIQRLVHPVSTPTLTTPTVPADTKPEAMEAMMAARQPTAFVVVDYAMSSLVEEANPRSLLPKGMEILVVRADTGQVISASDPAKVGATSMTLLNKLPKDPEAQLKFTQEQFAFTYATTDDVQMQASARFWRPEDGCWTVIVQPNESVLQPVMELENGIQEAWKSAMTTVSSEGDDFIQERDELAQKTQQMLTESASQQMVRNERKLMQGVGEDFQKHQQEVGQSLEKELVKDISTLQQGAGDAMANQALAQAGDAGFRFAGEASGESQRAAARIKEGASRVAARAAGKMILNSAWLIPLFLVLALFLATLTARSLVKPINQLVRGTQALAAGEYNKRIPVRGDDELARLAIAFNDMAGAIQRGQDDLQQSHDSLATEKAKIEGIVDASPDGLVMLEPGGHVAFMNPTAMQLLGLVPSEAPAAPFALAQIPGLAGQRLQDCLEVTADADGIREFEFTEPQRCVLQLRSVRLCSGGGREFGRLLHLHDITRERVIDEMKSDFISLVSHELRTPLTSILGFSSYMLTGKLGTVAESQKMALDSIHRQAKRLSAIISDFLDISRIESGKIEMKKEPVPVPQIAARVAEDLRPQAAEKSVKVNTRVEESPYPLVADGDEQRIAQVFTNLVGNALKFTEPQGEIDIVLSRQNGELVCRVKDTGCGIPPDELDRVFDRFYQVEKVVTRKSGGTGLGLAIVKNIIEAHGGRVWIESQVGKGTVVSFTLPGHN